ncbi:MmcQ/YjbR family DNA-binding protein [Myroides ceti]|uniref:MmcQ/YjbR family DNA-binding protein n=1 Tax=Paenimyroides ceti TaxID=395087 RepID=A0ABT8CUQ8_9FLAO|nr:MmcQ/YjbR family DNA-binding protein [Paenimyroides ceti]MDN3707481.1 MmcQ/YjbR family DNA-binding protein [Paenimyroides ceti]
MNIEDVRNFCLSLKGAEEKMPFDDKTLVFSVKGKMFCATDITTFKFLNLKCDPEEAIILREKYSDVMPGYYMNKKLWNSVKTTGKITDKQMKDWILNSYDLVVAGLPKKTQKELGDE